MSQEYHQSHLKPIVNGLLVTGILFILTHFTIKYYENLYQPNTIQTKNVSVETEK